MVARASSSSISLVAAVLAGLLVSSTYAVTQEKKWTGIGRFTSQDHEALTLDQCKPHQWVFDLGSLCHCYMIPTFSITVVWCTTDHVYGVVLDVM